MTARYIVVCSGNICRSPLAAALAAQKLSEAGHEAVVISAGTLNIVGKPAAPHSVTVAMEYGVDISHHRSQGLSPAMANLADALLVMAPNHVEAIERLQITTPVVKLWEWGDDLDQISDPIGQRVDAFRACGEIINGCLDRWIASLG